MFRWLLLFLRHYFLLFVFGGTIFGTCILKTYGSVKKEKEPSLTFSGLTLPPASGNKPDSMVVLLHGYGDIGENFLCLGALWGEALPNTLFVALDAPVACAPPQSGKSWFRIKDKSPNQKLKQMKRLAPYLNRYLDDLLKSHGIPLEKLAFVGFSQGARMALHVGLRRSICAGILAFSGGFSNDSTASNLSRTPILLIHGLEDHKAPSSLAREAYKCLEALHMPVTLFLFPQLGHDIDARGVTIGGEFLKECFYSCNNILG